MFDHACFRLIVLALILGCGMLAYADEMQRVSVEGIELEYEVKGNGEPVVLIHPGVIADSFKPLLGSEMLPKHFRVISYHRIGYAGSSHVQGTVSIEQQARHVRLLMQHVGIQKAHVVGHSSGGNIALQLALDAPDAVHTLILLEPALRAQKSAAERASAFAPVHEHYRKGNKAEAIDAFMTAVAGSNYRSDIDRLLPGAMDQAVKDADTFLGQELPALGAWEFNPEIASRIKQPVLAVIGGKNVDIPVWKERQEMLLTWLPNAKPFVLSDTTHFLHVQNPQGFMNGITNFCKLHPIQPSN